MNDSVEAGGDASHDDDAAAGGVLGPGPTVGSGLGLPAGSAPRGATAVVGVGRISAARAATHRHRNMMRAALPAGLSSPEAAKDAARRRFFPVDQSRENLGVCLRRIGNLEGFIMGYQA